MRPQVLRSKSAEALSIVASTLARSACSGVADGDLLAELLRELAHVGHDDVGRVQDGEAAPVTEGLALEQIAERVLRRAHVAGASSTRLRFREGPREVRAGEGREHRGEAADGPG
jgi:hypothetical protein